MQQSILWSADNTPISIQGKSLKLRELFARTANAAIAKGLSRDEAIFAASNAVKSEEKKNQPAKTKAKTIASFTSPFEVVSKAAEDQVPEVATVKAAEFDAQGHLVLLMTDGKRIVTKGKAVEQHINQSVGVSVNPVFDHVQMNTTANYTSEDYLPGMLTWNEFEDCLVLVIR